MDLTRHDPNNPGQEQHYDGTGALSDGDRANTNRNLEQLAVSIESAWQRIDFWPWLPMKTVGSTAEVLELEMLVDILGTVIVNSLELLMPLVESMSQEEVDSLAGNMVENFWYMIGSFVVPFILAQGLAYGLVAIENMNWNPLNMLVGLGIWLGLFLSYVTYMTWLVLEGELHPFGVAFGGYLSLVVVLIATLRNNILDSCRLLRTIKYYRLSDLLEVEDFLVRNRIRTAIWNTVIGFVKVFAFVVLLYNFAQLVYMGLTM